MVVQQCPGPLLDQCRLPVGPLSRATPVECVLVDYSSDAVAEKRWTQARRSVSPLKVVLRTFSNSPGSVSVV